MRIRSIRPEFWSSEDIAALDWHTRLVFIGLWSYVDDNGVGRDVERLIVADLFPLDDDLSEASVRVHGALKLLEAGGQLARYVVDGKPYLHITAFADHQVINRPSRGRYPLPTSENAEPRPSLSEGSVRAHASAVHGEGEKGRRGEGELLSGEPDEDEPDLFADFYAAYPRKEARRKAEQAWRAAVKRADPSVIMAGLWRFQFREERQFIPLPASWLNADRWADEPSGLSLVPGTGRISDEQLQSILGPDRWTCPRPPAGLSPDEEWEWRRQQQLGHIEERQAQARARTGAAS